MNCYGEWISDDGDISLDFLEILPNIFYSFFYFHWKCSRFTKNFQNTYFYEISLNIVLNNL